MLTWVCRRPSRAASIISMEVACQTTLGAVAAVSAAIPGPPPLHRRRSLPISSPLSSMLSNRLSSHEAKSIQTDVSFSLGVSFNRYVNMGEMSSPESLSPNRLNQALISETLSEFPHFEFVSTNTADQAASLVGALTNTDSQDAIAIFETSKQGITTDPWQ